MFFCENYLQNGANMPPKILPKSILGPPWAQMCVKDGPREPPTTDFHVFCRFGLHFLWFLDQVLIDIRSFFDCLYHERRNDRTKHRLFGLAGFRLRITISGGGLSARVNIYGVRLFSNCFITSTCLY